MSPSRDIGDASWLFKTLINNKKDGLARHLLTSDAGACVPAWRHQDEERFMITRQRIATVLTTTAMAYSICSPAQAAGLVGVIRPDMREAIVDDADRALKNAVRAALGVDGIDVSVSSHNGEVTLAGVMRNAAELARVLQAAMSVPGVRQIDNALLVRGDIPDRDDA
jgi:osmotically-inducible protein OsmY